MTIAHQSLNSAVSTALTGWLALAEDDRATLAHAIAALTGLDPRRAARADAVAVTAAPPTPPTLVDQILTIDAVSAVDTELFRSRSYRALGAGQSMAIYCAGARGLLALAQEVGRAHYKIGWSRGAGAHTRIAHLRATAYGACWRDGDTLVRDEGWDSWEATVLPVGERPTGSPVRGLGQAIMVDLPAGLDAGAVDRALTQALAPRALARMGDADATRMRRFAEGVDPARLRRLTEKPTPRGMRLRAAQELFCFAPRQEADALARLIEAVVAQAVAPLMRR